MVVGAREVQVVQEEMAVQVALREFVPTELEVLVETEALVVLVETEEAVQLV